jgi:hypothetical protein
MHRMDRMGERLLVLILSILFVGVRNLPGGSACNTTGSAIPA